MGHFIKSRIAEFLACVCMSVGVCYAIYAGFVLTDSMSGSPFFVILVAAAVTAVMYVFSYNRLTVGIGIGVGVVFVAIVVILMNTKTPWEDESANSGFLFWVITVVVSVLVFLITRSRIGCVIGIIVSNLIFAGSYFLDFPVELWQYLVLVVGSIVLFFIRVYMISALKANTGKIKLGKYLVQSLIVALAAFLVAVGLFFTVVKAINPPTMEMQLLQVLRSMEIFEIFGLATTQEVYDPGVKGNNQSNEENANQQGDQDNDEPEGDPDDPEAENNPDDDTDENNDEDQILNSQLFQDLKAISYDLTGAKLFMLIAIVILLIVEVFLIRMIVKQQWRRRVQELPREDGVINYYNFFLKRFKRIGYKKPDNYTAWDYAELMEHQLEPYSVGESTFVNLTRIYNRVYYGGKHVTDKEWELYEVYYDNFHKNLRKDIGKVKYILKIFRI